eukprot:10969997-Alexandrium_andersonii.AAC.1
MRSASQCVEMVCPWPSPALSRAPSTGTKHATQANADTPDKGILRRRPRASSVRGALCGSAFYGL